MESLERGHRGPWNINNNSRGGWFDRVALSRRGVSWDGLVITHSQDDVVRTPSCHRAACSSVTRVCR